VNATFLISRFSIAIENHTCGHSAIIATDGCRMVAEWLTVIWSFERRHTGQFQQQCVASLRVHQSVPSHVGLQQPASVPPDFITLYL